MAKVDVLMPKMGESVAEATVIRWLKQPGDRIETDEPIMEIATDKVDSEIPSPVEGILAEQCCAENDVVQVGARVAVISTEAASGEPTAATTAPVAASSVTVSVEPKTVAHEHDSDIPKRSESGKFYSPLVRNIAKEEGIALTELESISGTGKDGRVTKTDIIAHLETRGITAVAATPAAPASISKSVAQQPVAAPQVSGQPMAAKVHTAPAISLMPGDEIMEMDRMRRMIADHMVMSKSVSAHVTSFVEADVTNIVLWRERVKKDFEKREGQKLTFTPIFIECLVRAIKDYPGVNISVDGYNIVRRKSINIGMAAAMPNGNLIVPVIKNADQKNLVGLAAEVNDLADRARQSKLKPEEIQGGTYTLTNVGSFGNVMGTPVINQPQVAIMAAGAIRKKPAVIETPQGDAIAIRHMMFLSHSYDHRVVDGSLGGMFVRRFADYLENWDISRTI
jgi:2-oxoglutarate dehydrogenase E2 component (dihydrolipoamide succinyltransferase)